MERIKLLQSLAILCRRPTQMNPDGRTRWRNTQAGTSKQMGCFVGESERLGAFGQTMQSMQTDTKIPTDQLTGCRVVIDDKS